MSFRFLIFIFCSIFNSVFPVSCISHYTIAISSAHSFILLSNITEYVTNSSLKVQCLGCSLGMKPNISCAGENLFVCTILVLIPNAAQSTHSSYWFKGKGCRSPVIPNCLPSNRVWIPVINRWRYFSANPILDGWVIGAGNRKTFLLCSSSGTTTFTK